MVLRFPGQMSNRTFEAASQERRYPIRVVSRRTGVKPDTIRAWEKRYGAVEPARSETRRRLYSESDIQHLILLRRATEAGWRIGQVATLPDEELQELVLEDEAATGGDDRPEPENEVIRDCLRAVERLDQDELVRIFERASLEYGRKGLILEVLAPLLEEVGEAWARGRLRPVHEHLLTSLVREIVSAGRAMPGPDAEKGPQIVVTTPRGQIHEMGALLAAAVADDAGWHVLYLGANLPAEEIALAAYRTPTQVVALGITYPPDDPTLASELRKLMRLLPERTRLVVGGRSAPAYADTLEEVGARVVEDLSNLQEMLQELRPGS